jgi:hypothetical protein
MGLFGAIGGAVGSIWGPAGSAIGGAAGGLLDNSLEGNSVEDRLRAARNKSMALSKKGSEDAARLMRESYADAFRMRAAGVTGSLTTQGRALDDQAASQGLNPTVGRNLLGERRAAAELGLSGAAAEAGANLKTDLARLAKGTATEQLGIENNFQTQMVNYQISKAAQDTTVSSGMMGALGSIMSAKDKGTTGTATPNSTTPNPASMPKPQWYPGMPDPMQTEQPWYGGGGR